ncbi:MAG TPA: DUF2270 domain-containing protein [Blastocatellia bacterium]|nr:DUF2270 domain-containing protein [Blastocatellia bacterium]
MERVSDPIFNAAEIGALAHLYRGEMYRSKIWRTRLDTTTNWSVATTSIALSVTFSSNENSPLPLILVGLLVMVFLGIEARRYRYFDIWRTRVRTMEVYFYGPILKGRGLRTESGWNEALARDYEHLQFHISFWEAAGRRLRRNYAWIFAIQGVSYLTKIAVHPTVARTLGELWDHAAIGPVPGQVVLLIGAMFQGSLILLATLTLRGQHASGRVERPKDYDVQMLK